MKAAGGITSSGWSLPNKVPPSFLRPRWDGSSLEGKTILVFAEQGLGDTIQFARYLPLVKERGGTVLFHCQRERLGLCAGMRGVDQLFAVGAPLPRYDVQVALLSLPGIFHTTPATIPAPIPYLHADRRMVEHWNKELVPLGGFKVGIVWQGSTKHPGDRYRSIPLTRFETLARLEGVRLVSLQKGPGAEQLSKLSLTGVPAILDLSERLLSFVDTAAVVMNLDLVITVDSSVAHLAGALAVPVWVPLPFAPDWRWLLERPDSPWYPTMRLFRQRSFGEWGPVMEDVKKSLSVLSAGGKQLKSRWDFPA